MSTADDKAPATRIEQTIAEIATLATQFDVFRFLKRLTETYGMRAFLVMGHPSEMAQELAGATLITNWPAELLTLYDQQRLLPESPVWRHFRDSTLPYSFHPATAAPGGPGDESARYAALFERFGMAYGVWFPVHDASGGRGAISLSGNRTPYSTQELMELSYLFIHVYDRLYGIRKKDMHVKEVLTERETACLNWTAAGKTSAEIADILQLSEHTVNHYLNRATRKLDAVNRTQAVAKALRQNIIK